jgi:hypothetical protein
MEKHDFKLSVIIEGAAENVSQFIILLKSIYDKKLCFSKQKCIFEHCRKVMTINNLYNYNFF